MRAVFTLAFAFFASVASAQIGPGGGGEPIGPGSSQGSGGAPGPTPPSQPALLPPDPISPTPNVELNWQAGTFIGCANTAACISDVRAGTEVCYSLTGALAMTTAAINTPCATDYGLHRASAGTNIALQSENESGAGWSHSTMVFTANGAVGPDGAMTGNIWSDITNGAGGFGSFCCLHKANNNSFSVVAGTTYTFSKLYKMVTHRWVQIAPAYAQFSVSAYADFDLQLCSVSGTGTSFTVADLTVSPLAGAQPLAGGWCRVWFQETATASGASSVDLAMIPFGQATYDQQYIGLGETLLTTKLMVEAGNLTPYCVTTTATALCNADSLTATGALLTVESGAQGYVVADLNPVPYPTVSYVLSRNGTTDAFLMTDSQGLTANSQVSGIDVASAFTGSLPNMSIGPSNFGSSWDGTGVSVVMNGGTVEESATPYGGTINAVIAAGSDIDISRIFGGTTRVSDPILQALAPLHGTPAPAPKTLYFAAAGNDTNPCSISQPCLTMAHAQALHHAIGDSILFNGGDAFTGCLALSSANVSGDSGVTLTVGSYGTGLPVMTSNCGGTLAGMITVTNLGNVTIQGLQLVGNGGSPSGSTAGILFVNSSTSVLQNNAVIGNTIGGFFDTGTGWGAEVFVEADFSAAGLNNFQLINNKLCGSSPSANDDFGYYALGFGENITNPLFQGNELCNQGGHHGGVSVGEGSGMVANGINATMQFNLAHDNGGNNLSCGGPVALWFDTALNSAIRYNEAYNQGPVQPYPITQNLTISSGTYNSSTGVVILTLTTGQPVIDSTNNTNFSISGAAGTGSFASINGAKIATNAPGSNISFTIATGLTMTITGGSVSVGFSVGSGYVNGTYTNVPLVNVNNTGSGALATIVVSGGAVTSFTITDGGKLYTANTAHNQVTVSNASLGGSGSGFLYRVIGSFGGCDNEPFDLDQASAGDVVEYNYGHDSWGTCFLAFAASNGIYWGHNTFRYNVCQNTGGSFSAPAVCLGTINGQGILDYYNNTCYISPTSPGAGSGYTVMAQYYTGLPGLVANNIFFADCAGCNYLEMDAGGTNQPMGVYLTNDYASTQAGPHTWKTDAVYTTLAAWKADGGDQFGLNVDPLLSSKGTGGTCLSGPPPIASGPQPCPTAYELTHSSTMIGAGFDLTVVTVGAPDCIMQSSGFCNPPSSVASGGSGYSNVGQLLTVLGGTCTRQPKIWATASGGAITTSGFPADPGSCSVAPTSPASTTTSVGSGVGATLTMTFVSSAYGLNVGTQDYYGDVIPNTTCGGTGYNVGADGACR